jgi:hypothetical protein
MQEASVYRDSRKTESKMSAPAIIALSAAVPSRLFLGIAPL